MGGAFIGGAFIGGASMGGASIGGADMGGASVGAELKLRGGGGAFCEKDGVGGGGGPVPKLADELSRGGGAVVFPPDLARELE